MEVIGVELLTDTVAVLLRHSGPNIDLIRPEKCNRVFSNANMLQYSGYHIY